MSDMPAEKTYRFGINLLGLVAAGLMVGAMFYPWWSMTMMDKTSNIYPYLVEGPASEIIGYKRSPQMTLLTGVLIATITLTFLGSILKRNISRILLVVAGALALLGTWRLLARVTGVAARFDIPIQGEGVAVYEGFAHIDVSTQLELGTYLVVAGAGLAILACFLQRWVRVGN
jgi:hypothetical protein